MNPIQHALEINNGKAILLSIKKEWLDKIMAGDKVMEVRKTMEKVLKGMGAATQRKFRKLLHKLPDEVTIYRGEAEASAPYTKAFSWTTDIRVAYFFACRQSDGYARVVSAKVKKQDILFMLDSR